MNGDIYESHLYLKSMRKSVLEDVTLVNLILHLVNSTCSMRLTLDFRLAVWLPAAQVPLPLLFALVRGQLSTADNGSIQVPSVVCPLVDHLPLDLPQAVGNSL